MARKTYKGEINNKERTKKTMIQSVGLVLEKYGYKGLTSTNIARKAQVDRKLIKLYFGSLEKLIETYIESKDYWISASSDAIDTLSKITDGSSRFFLESLLLNQIDHFSKDEEMQKVVLWQISEKSDIMEHVTRSREKLSSLFFPISDTELAGKDVDLRAVSSLLVAGIYYLVLHSKTTDSTFCEIDITTEKGMERIKDAVKAILKQTYESVGK